MPLGKFVSAIEAAEILGCTSARIRQLIEDGILVAERFGNKSWAVEKKSVDQYKKMPQKRGRPRGSKNLSATA